MSPISARAPVLLVVALAIVLETLAADRIAVSNGFVAGFPAQTLQELRDQWLWSGCAVSAPLPPLIALAVFVVLAQLRWRRVRIIACAGCLLLAALFVFACASEPTFLHPVSSLEFLLQLLVIALAIALGGAGMRAVVSSLRHPVDHRGAASGHASAASRG